MPYATLNIAVLAPIPKASASTATTVNPGFLRKRAQPVTQILQKLFQQVARPRLPDFFLHLLDAARFDAARRAPRFRGTMPAARFSSVNWSRYSASVPRRGPVRRAVRAKRLRRRLARRLRRAIRSAPYRLERAGASQARWSPTAASRVRNCRRPAAVSR